MLQDGAQFPTGGTARKPQGRLGETPGPTVTVWTEEEISSFLPTLQDGAQFPTGGTAREPQGRFGETPKPTVQSG